MLQACIVALAMIYIRTSMAAYPAGVLTASLCRFHACCASSFSWSVTSLSFWSTGCFRRKLAYLMMPDCALQSCQHMTVRVMYVTSQRQEHKERCCNAAMYMRGCRRVQIVCSFGRACSPAACMILTLATSISGMHVCRRARISMLHE